MFASIHVSVSPVSGHSISMDEISRVTGITESQMMAFLALVEQHVGDETPLWEE